MKSCQFCHSKSSVVSNVPFFWMTEQRGGRTIEQLGDSGRLLCECAVAVLSTVPVRLDVCEECSVSASYQLSNVVSEKM